MMQNKFQLVIDQITQELAISTNAKTMDELRVQLANAVEQLLQTDFSRLIQILYRLDVDEEKLKNELKKHQTVDAADVIASMIIKRQLEKQEMRKHFRGDQDISDEDKW